MALKNKKVIDFFNTYKKDQSLQFYRTGLEEYDFFEFAIWGIEHMLQSAYIHNTGEDMKNIKQLNINNCINNIILNEVKDLLSIETLNTRNSDRLDFKEYNCWLVEEAILKMLEY